MSGLDSRFVTSIDLEPYFVSKDTGEALAGGIVTFYVDDNTRTKKKLVYQLTQDPMTGAYSYAPLPNPMILSGVGTFQDSGGNNIAVYYYPFDEFGNQELYYITVYDKFNNLQFTREAWPFPNTGGGGGVVQPPYIGLTNQLSNPQFARVNFVSPLVITISGAGTTTIPLAPDWDLNIVATGASTVTVTQTPIVGQSRLPFNPPFTLDFVIGANITSCQVIQTLHNNPDWAAPQVTGTMGYLSGSILLGSGTSVNMQYVPSIGTTQSILNTSNVTGQYAQVNATIGLVAANNTQNGNVGYDQIVINILNLPGSASISNVQAIPLTSNVSGVQYDQTPVNRQIDHLFNYYNDLLQYKPIPSLLDAWDFPLNPAQFLGSTVAASAIGANKSKYVWDQTIIFQSANTGVGVSRSIDGSIVLTAAADTQMAMIQYQPQIKARKILFNKAAVHVVADTTAVQNFTVSLWYTKDVSLPSVVASNNSLVATLGANGKPATFNGNWIEVPRSGLGDATFSTDGSGGYETFKFSGWQLLGADVHLATFFAIVVGTNTVNNGNSVVFNSAGLMPGDIATIPAPQSEDAVLVDVSSYYNKSFAGNVVPAQNVGNSDVTSWVNVVTGANTAICQTIFFTSDMYVAPTITFFNPNAANALAYNYNTLTSVQTSTVQFAGTKGFSINYRADAGSAPGDVIGIHWTADARLGF